MVKTSLNGLRPYVQQRWVPRVQCDAGYKYKGHKYMNGKRLLHLRSHQDVRKFLAGPSELAKGLTAANFVFPTKTADVNDKGHALHQCLKLRPPLPVVPQKVELPKLGEDAKRGASRSLVKGTILKLYAIEAAESDRWALVKVVETCTGDNDWNTTVLYIGGFMNRQVRAYKLFRRRWRLAKVAHF